MNQEPYTPLETTAMVFAARYTHNRPTSGTYAIVQCLIANWSRIDYQSQRQILREAKYAPCNPMDWQKLFDHANYKPTEQ